MDINYKFLPFSNRYGQSFVHNYMLHAIGTALKIRAALCRPEMFTPEEKAYFTTNFLPFLT